MTQAHCARCSVRRWQKGILCWGGRDHEWVPGVEGIKKLRIMELAAGQDWESRADLARAAGSSEGYVNQVVRETGIQVGKKGAA